MKYRITICHGRHDATASRTDPSYIYVDTDRELTKKYGIYEREGSVGAGLYRDRPVPGWITRILKIPGVLSVNLSHYGLFLTYAPLFDDQKIVTRVARVLKDTFAKEERLQRLPDYNPPRVLLPEDLEYKLRQIIEDHFYRSRRWALRKSSKEK